MITIQLNNESQALAPGTTVAALITARGADCVVVAVNDRLVPRGCRDGHILRDGDRVELLTPMEGG
jgi:sulfur carrier protein